MILRDWQWLIIMTGLVTGSTFVFSLSGELMEEMLGLSLIVGSIILLIRRGILKVKRKLEKKQAV